MATTIPWQVGSWPWLAIIEDVRPKKFNWTLFRSCWAIVASGVSLVHSSTITLCFHILRRSVNNYGNLFLPFLYQRPMHKGLKRISLLIWGQICYGRRYGKTITLRKGVRGLLFWAGVKNGPRFAFPVSFFVSMTSTARNGRQFLHCRACFSRSWTMAS